MLIWNIPHNTYVSKDRKFDKRNFTLEFDLLTLPESTIATFAVLATDSDPACKPTYLQSKTGLKNVE
jgi:hypothetical protein